MGQSAVAVGYVIGVSVSDKYMIYRVSVSDKYMLDRVSVSDKYGRFIQAR